MLDERSEQLTWSSQEGAKWEYLVQEPRIAVAESQEYVPTRREKYPTLKGKPMAPADWATPLDQRSRPLVAVLLDPEAKPPSRHREAEKIYRIFGNESVTVPPYGTRRISTGLALEIHPSTIARIVAAPKLEWCVCVTVERRAYDVSSAEELKVSLHNHSDVPLRVMKGQLIAGVTTESA